MVFLAAYAHAEPAQLVKVNLFVNAHLTEIPKKKNWSRAIRFILPTYYLSRGGDSTTPPFASLFFSFWRKDRFANAMMLLTVVVCYYLLLLLLLLPSMATECTTCTIAHISHVCANQYPNPSKL
jgi:hypothetical protein